MPVCPATPAVLDRPLGVAAITFPNLSVTHITVVPPCQGPVIVGGLVGFMLYGSPGRSSRDAFFGSISWRRILVYGKQLLHRHRHKVRIAVILVAIRQRKFFRFNH